MKRAGFVLLCGIFIINSSFKPEEEVKGVFSATIDGKSFQLDENEPLKGILARRSGSMDGRTAGSTVISITAYGPSYDKPDGHEFSESVQIEMTYEGSKLGEPTAYVLGLQFESTNYAMVTDQTKLRITQIDWEEDHKHFRLAAEFSGKMRSWGYPSDKKSDVSLSGKMSNIRVTVPVSLAIKN